MTTTPALLQFRVYGVPQPGGSKRGFVNPKTGRVIITEDAKRNKTWRESVKVAALEAMGGVAIVATGPLVLDVMFVMPRPKYHFGSGKNADRLKPSAPYWHTTKPDATKLLRSTEDALTEVAWGDDAQIAWQRVRKRYAMVGEQPGAIVLVDFLREEGPREDETQD